uniref:Aminopeptidase n=1 Tax=Electrophorus electricus TaxID=8005 RepID=A0A4W4GQZ5_ELEEL
MGKGFYISKTVAAVAIVVGAAAVATIIALSVVYSQEKDKNTVKPADVVTTAVPTFAPTTAPSNDPWHRYRLPDTLVPEFYDVILWPHIRQESNRIDTFTGNSSVVFRCVRETDLILIHSNKLNLTAEPTLTALSGTPAPIIHSTWMQDTTQYLVMQLNSKLTAGESYVLLTEFVGELGNGLGGFYRSEYKENGKIKVIATTQMQPTDARKVFPCFDEPAMKATFNITLLHDHNTIALSNGKEIESVNVTINGISLKKTRFEQTKRMSTYLLAFVVSEFDHIAQTDGNVLIRIYARREAISAGHGNYSLQITGPILNFFESYYNTRYPLYKSDQIALPDFNAGAMENWGLITYRETALLFDPEVSSSGNKERIATIISHELAHMWFGNLVTLKWWNDLWLNEGFASYVEYLGADHAEPLWNIKDLIVLNDIHRVFAVDALASSHPLSSKEEDIMKPEQISELFDTISYSKGASVLRMLSDFLTEPIFVQGLSSYLNHFQFNNTVYRDLWDHLQDAVISSGTKLPMTVGDIMDRWVLQMGFPVVTINTTTGDLTQEHFLLDPQLAESLKGEQWSVLQGATHVIFACLLATSGLCLSSQLNMDLRRNYIGYRQRSDKCIINRAQLIDDAFNLARAQHICTTLALQTTKYLSAEREYMPWQTTLNNLDYYYLMFDRNEVYDLLQKYVRKQVEPLFYYFKSATANWTEIPSGLMDQYNEVNAIRMACSTGVEECVSLIKGWFQQWMDNEAINLINPNLRSTVYCSAIAAGGAKEWDFAWRMFLNTNVATEAEKLRAALACSTVPWILNRYLEYTLNPELIRKQDATSTIIYIANNVVGQPLAWEFIRANWAYIFSEYGGGSFSFSNLINGVTKRFSSLFELKQLEQFRDDNADVGFGSGTLAIQQSIERTRANIRWLEQNKAEVTEWLKKATEQ